jgi:hypothetical protein
VLRLAAAAALLVLACSPSARAQSRWLAGYLQTVPLWTGTTALAEGHLSDFNRFRLTIEPVFGRVAGEVVYEQATTFRTQGAMAGFGLGSVQGGGEYLDLQWTLSEREHVLWRHRFDRLKVGWRPTDAVELSLGRQAVSWGTTLFLTPADPFIPFNPADPFREFRAGVDAARVRMSPSPLSEIDVVVRPTRTAAGEEMTALARGLVTWRNWELSGWGGSLYGDAAGAFGASGAIGAWAVRGEAVVREVRDQVIVRGTVGVDHLQQVLGRDLSFLFEYQHDGLGASSPDDYLIVSLSDPSRRGELQVLGRDEAVIQAAYKLHPLWSLSGLWLWNLNDRSALLAPSVGYSASDEISIAGGVYFGIGDAESTLARPLPSEHGLLSTTAYVSISWYF